MITLSTTVNGTPRTDRVRPERTLLDYLRDELRLKGTVEGCGVGMCGSCTVLVDGQPMTACLTLAADVDGREVTTIEGVGSADALDPVQEAFLEHQAFQCGYCTPGMILAVKALLASDPEPTREAAAEHLAGNLCRCGTYLEVLDAVASLAARGAEARSIG